MPSLDFIKKLNNRTTLGEVRRNNSDIIMESTWDGDISSQVAYIYDYYHDDEPLLLKGLNPTQSATKVPVDIKFFEVTYNSENKDQQGFHIQFKPSFNWEDIEGLNYYQKAFVEKYSAEYPMGLYIDIFDKPNKCYRKWMITAPGYWLGNQFPSYFVLPCDHIYQWMHKGKKYQMAGVGRSQSSYNSGEYRDHMISSVENQEKCILPMNDISTTIFYNKRIVISAPIETPIVWHCSKVSQDAPNGVNRLTFAQEEWNADTDVFEYEDGEITSEYIMDKRVVGMWANYNDVPIIPETKPEPERTVYSTISYSGVKPEVNVGGSFKKLTVKFFDDKDEEIEFRFGKWSYTIDDNDASDLIEVKTEGLEQNQVAIKFIGGNEYLNKVMLISYTSNDGVVSTLNMMISGL